MSIFAYSARGSDGQVRHGSIDADNVQAARLALSQMNLIPVELRETETTNRQVHWRVTEDGSPTAPDGTPPPGSSPTKTFAPLVDTFRLYAGWLVAWYALVFLLGWYVEHGGFPLQIPFLTDLFHSSLVLHFALAAFLFLCLTSLHRAIGRGVLRGLLLTVAGVSAFLFFAVNV